MASFITASMLYDLIACPHRVEMDMRGDPLRRDSVSPFVQLLWERGSAHEAEVIAGLAVPFLDLSGFAGDEKERLTIEALRRGDGLIYGGRIRSGDLLGDPDLLRREGAGYVAGDIKSGSGEEGGGEDDDGKPKKHYAVQVALYTDILERLGLSAGRRAFIWDIHRREVTYELSAPYGERNPRTLWSDYQDALAEARRIVANQDATVPAYASSCKQCWWHTECLDQLQKSDDLTLIPELGRSKRDVMVDRIATVADLASINPSSFLQGKKTVFAGVGPDTLTKFRDRARLLVQKDAKPYLRQPVALPVSDTELFFDIEVDPMRDVCYLHGFVVRRGQENATEQFMPFFADDPTPEAEKTAFASSVGFIKASPNASIFYYSKYERTLYRKLQAKYPDVCTAAEIEDIFAPTRAVDLYFDVVKAATEWPTNDHSIKTLAKFLGFKWRDTHPSGAASIEWFDQWVQRRDLAMKQRILDYNEDDCRATRVLLDGIRTLR